MPSSDYLVPYLIDTLADKFPWFLGAIGRMCASRYAVDRCSLYVDCQWNHYPRFIPTFHNREASQAAQVAVGRVTVGVVVSLALLVGGTPGDLLVLLGGTAVSYGFQMAWPALLGICYIRFFTGKGVAWGLAAGLTAVTFTYITELGGLIGIGRYPLTLHSAGWGIFFNLLVTILVSALTREEAENPSPPRALSRLSARTHRLISREEKMKKPIWLLTSVCFSSP